MVRALQLGGGVMNTRTRDDPGPWLEVEAHYRHETGGATALWVGDIEKLKEVWVWIPDPFIRRPNPVPRGKVEILEIREKWVVDKSLEGCVVDDALVEQEDLFT